MLRAIHAKTGKPVEIGDEITDFRGDKAILISLDRVNEQRYGGRRSGKVSYRREDGRFGSEVYDSVFDLIVINSEWENASTLNAEPNEPRQINSLKERGL